MCTQSCWMGEVVSLLVCMVRSPDHHTLTLSLHRPSIFNTRLAPKCMPGSILIQDCGVLISQAPFILTDRLAYRSYALTGGGPRLTSSEVRPHQSSYRLTKISWRKYAWGHLAPGLSSCAISAWYSILFAFLWSRAPASLHYQNFSRVPCFV